MTDRSTSNFDTMGESMATEVVNASAGDAAPYPTARHRPQPSHPPTKVCHRAPLLIDAVTGQELADRVNVALAYEAASIRGTQPDRRAAERGAVHAEAVHNAVDGLDHAGRLGAGLALSSPAATVQALFGVSGR